MDEYWGLLARSTNLVGLKCPSTLCGNAFEGGESGEKLKDIVPVLDSCFPLARVFIGKIWKWMKAFIFGSAWGTGSRTKQGRGAEENVR